MTNTEKMLNELEEINRKLNIMISDKSGTANCESAQKIEAEKSLNPKVDSKTATAETNSKEQTLEELKDAVSAINAISSPESATKAVTQACLAMGKALNLGIWSIGQRENIRNKLYEVELFQISAPQLSEFIQIEMIKVITWFIKS